MNILIVSYRYRIIFGPLLNTVNDIEAHFDGNHFIAFRDTSEHRSPLPHYLEAA
jgi:hypothetical protein